MKFEIKKVFRAIIRAVGPSLIAGIVDALIEELHEKLADEVTDPGNTITQDFVDILGDNKTLVSLVVKKLF